tara:strand:- start:1355 stop:1678 length:324 start_codon:yes stop_codon:yes gene_type:complete
MSNHKDTHFITFILKYTVISSVLCLILADIYKQHINALISYVIDPIFSIDLDQNGEPDLKQLKGWSVTLKQTTVPIGLIIYNVFIVTLKLALLFTILHILIKYLNLC